jgi:AraC-like DNA-binding protein
MTVRRSGVEEFVGSPFGRYVAGATFVVWCFDATFAGSVTWGSPTELEIRQLLRSFDFDAAMNPGYAVVTDGSRLVSIDPVPFGLVIDYVQRKLPDYTRSVGRQAFVHREGLVGASIAGLAPALSVPWQWRPFWDEAAAFEWIGHPAAARVREEVRAITEPLATLPESLRALGEYLSKNLHSATLRSAGRALGFSERSLQRALAAAGTTFRREVSRARVEAAARLLSSTSAKLDAIAREVGCASGSHLSQLFRRERGETPGAYRARRMVRS